MQVSYRGISYETSASPMEAIETEQTGLFLGKRFKLKQYNVSQRSAEPMQLKYRGVDYHQ